MELRILGLVFLAFSVFALNGTIAQEKNKSAFRVRIYVGGYGGVFETKIENNELLVVRRNELLRNGKKVSKIAELLKNGFVEQLRNGNRNAQLSHRLRGVEMLAFYGSGIKNAPDFPVDFTYGRMPEAKISDEIISDVSVRDKAGNILFCGYLGSQLSEVRITGSKLVLIQGKRELASFNSIVEFAKIVNSELNGSNQRSTLEPLPDGAGHSQFSRFASRVILNDEKNELCWWLAECEFRSIVAHHLLRMKKGVWSSNETAPDKTN